MKLQAKLEAVRELLEWSKNAERENLKKRKKKLRPEPEDEESEEDKKEERD